MQNRANSCEDNNEKGDPAELSQRKEAYSSRQQAIPPSGDVTGSSNLDDVFSREHQARFDDAETGGPTPKFEQATETLLDLSEDLRKVMEKYGQEEGKPILIKEQTIVKALIGGLELAKSFEHTETQRGASAVPGRADSKSYAKIAAKGTTPWAKTPPEVAARRTETARAKKNEALEKLRAKVTFELDRDRQAIFEPEMDGYRKVEIPTVTFRREVEKALAERYNINETVEFCRRLERGGFRLQLSSDAWKVLRESASKREGKEVIIRTPSKGSWFMVDRFDPKTDYSIVIEGIESCLPLNQILDELMYYNH